MFKIILQDNRRLTPFNERARDLRIQNNPLWLHQRNVLAPHTTREREMNPGEKLPQERVEMLVYRDNLFFDESYIEAFIAAGKKKGRAVRAAFSSDDPAFKEHALPLSTSYTPAGDKYLADLWYYPRGPVADQEPLVIDMDVKEAGYYSVPNFMGGERRRLTFQCPARTLVAIDSWVHVFIADIVFGVFARARRADARSKEELGFRLKLLLRALYEGCQLLESSELVKIGKECVIDPHAVIHGPTTIGDNVEIAAGAVVENCIIGNNVIISQGCQLMLSVVGDGTFLPFDAKLFMTTIMDNSMVAQNTCLQMCVIGRNTFIGAGNTFTDFNLVSVPIKALDGNGVLQDANRPVLGGCVGHNCRIGSGLVIYPARTIESDVVLVASKERRIIDKNILYKDSDHHKFSDPTLHKRLHPQKDEEAIQEEWG